MIELLNRERHADIPSEYYSQIKIWRDWWRGFYKPFHEFRERDGEKLITRKLYTLKMAKKICEDWAAILLNEKTQIAIDDKASSEFVQGEDGLGGVFGENDFWSRGNALVEKVFYSGTGAFILRFSGKVNAENAILKGSETKISIDYVSAMNIIPLSVSKGTITEAAFVSESVHGGRSYIYLETHERDGDGYVIKNRYFKAENEKLHEEKLPAGIAPEIRINSPVPLFAILTPNTENTFDKSNGLGMGIYAHALDCLEGVDLAFNNFCRDFKLGGKKVFYNSSLIRRDEQGRMITPDDVAQQLFLQVGEKEMTENGGQNLVHEFNPSLRVAENREGIQAQLDYLSFKCGLGTKHYQFNAGSVVTATQYMGDRQELIQNAAKHYIVVERALRTLVRGILWLGKEIAGAPVNPDAGITVNFEDSYIIDKESERLRDLQEIRDGLMQKWEYRVKWRGEDEATAKKMTAEPDAGKSIFGEEGE